MVVAQAMATGRLVFPAARRNGVHRASGAAKGREHAHVASLSSTVMHPAAVLLALDRLRWRADFHSVVAAILVLQRALRVAAITNGRSVCGECHRLYALVEDGNHGGVSVCSGHV